MPYLLAVIVLLAAAGSWLLASHDRLRARETPWDHATRVVLNEPWPAAMIEDRNNLLLDGAGPAQRLYQHVLQEFRRQDYEAALAGFRLFAELYADSPLAIKATYWRGECAFRIGRYDEARAAFDAVLTELPRDAAQSPTLPSRLAAAALLKKGLLYAKQGRLEDWRRTLELVVVQFPNSAEARLARKSLLVPVE